MCEAFTGQESFILITLDSCRWDTFESAQTPNLSSAFVFRRAYSHGTYTLPAHISMYSGIFPDVRERIPFYNRFAGNLIRIAGRDVSVDSFIEFPGGTPSIYEGFEALGYRTTAVAAMEWFYHRALRAPFQHVAVTGIHLEKQLHHCNDAIAHGKPVALLLNVGETHDPYKCGGLIQSSLQSRARMRAFENAGFLRDDYDKQVAACEFIDNTLGAFLETVPRQLGRTVVVVCGDHGECFGEDGYYGHGFNHPKVSEVPLGIGILE